MADHINFAVSAVPIEELTDEQSNTVKVISGEVGRSLGGAGDSVDLSAYNGSGANQGFTNGAVVYKDTAIGDGTVPTALSAIDDPDFVYIKNTGHKYSSSSVLGATTTDCILVAISEQAWQSSTYGGYINGSNAGVIHYYGVAWLKPGQSIVLPYKATVLTKMGANATDFSGLNMAGDSSSNAKLCVKTFESDGTEATDGNAIEFLVVT
jgi:hypothetical protein